MGLKMKYPKRVLTKKLLVICILIISIIFITGCIDDEKMETGTTTSSQDNHESDTQTTDSILKQGDVPGLTLSSCTLFAVPKNAVDLNDRIKYYADTLPIGYKNVGEDSRWIDQSGREIRVELDKNVANQSTLDKYGVNQSTFEEFKDTILRPYKEMYESSFDYEEGDPYIGDYSFYYAYTDKNTEIQTTVIYSVYNYNSIWVYAVDDKDKSKKEAIRIAKIVVSRLD